MKKRSRWALTGLIIFKVCFLGYIGYLFYTDDPSSKLVVLKQNREYKVVVDSVWMKHLEQEVGSALFEASKKVKRGLMDVHQHLEAKEAELRERDRLNRDTSEKNLTNIKNIVDRQVGSIKSDLMKINQKVDKKQEDIVKENVPRQLREALDTIHEVVRRQGEKMFQDMSVEQRFSDSLYVRTEELPQELTLPANMKVGSEGNRIFFLFSKGITVEQFRDAIGWLKTSTFSSSLTGKMETLYPKFYQTKSDGDEVVGVSLDVDFPLDKSCVIFQHFMLGDRVVGFVYDIDLNRLTIYK